MGARLAVSWRDAVLPGAIAVAAVLELAALRRQGWAYAAGLVLAAALVLVWRRRWPVATSSFAVAAVFLLPWLGPDRNALSVPLLVVVLAAYTLGREAEGIRAGAALAVVGAVLGVDSLVFEGMADPSDLVFVAAIVGPPFVLGRLVRRLAEQRRQLMEQQQWIEREAVRAERRRIARDLHDVIAHSMSAMVVQATAARELVREDPRAAERALDEVSALGRSALAETGRLLHAVRDDSDELGLGPTPGLRELGELLDGFRARGLALEVQVDPDLPELPGGLGVSAYRIVQELLTNAFRHSADRAATLRLTLRDGALCITTSNACGSIGAAGRGLGLRGMAERAALFGGHLERRATSGGRFEVMATLPLPSPVPRDQPVAEGAP